MPIYVAAEVKTKKNISFSKMQKKRKFSFFKIQIVNYHADEVLSKDCEMSSLHQYLSYLPTEINENTWEEILKRASYLIKTHPPTTLDNLNSEWKIKW